MFLDGFTIEVAQRDGFRVYFGMYMNSLLRNYFLQWSTRLLQPRTFFMPYLGRLVVMIQICTHLKVRSIFHG